MDSSLSCNYIETFGYMAKILANGNRDRFETKIEIQMQCSLHRDIWYSGLSWASSNHFLWGKFIWRSQFTKSRSDFWDFFPSVNALHALERKILSTLVPNFSKFLPQNAGVTSTDTPYTGGIQIKVLTPLPFFVSLIYGIQEQICNIWSKHWVENSFFHLNQDITLVINKWKLEIRK